MLLDLRTRPQVLDAFYNEYSIKKKYISYTFKDKNLHLLYFFCQLYIICGIMDFSRRELNRCSCVDFGSVGLLNMIPCRQVHDQALKIELLSVPYFS